MLASIMIAASLAQAQDTTPKPIRVKACEHGQILNLPESALVGAFVDFGIKPDNGYELEALRCYYLKVQDGDTARIVFGPEMAQPMHFYFTMPDCDGVEICAYFKRAKYRVTIADTITNGELLLLQADGIEYGEQVQLLATPAADYMFGTASIITTRGTAVSYTVADADGMAKYINFRMPNDSVVATATFIPLPRYPIKVAEYEKGKLEANITMAKAGQRVELYATTVENYNVTNVKAVAGYEITGGGGNVHAPAMLKEQTDNLWFVQQEIPVHKFNKSIFYFTLPEQFDNVLTPTYQDNTEIRVTYGFEYAGPQVVFCEDNATLYFINPGWPVKVGETWRGHTITRLWAEEVADNGWNIPGWNDVREQVRAIEIEREFANAHPHSCYAWFYMFDVDKIEGLNYLNTSRVTNMNSMFTGCKNLTTIDVNSFDTRNVVNATSMFRGCSSLTTIYCDSTWNIGTADLMFLGSERLLGAEAYNSDNVTGTMANPTSGYFTGKWEIDIPEFSYGTVTCDSSTAYTNETVTLTVTPFSKYRLSSLTVSVAGEPSGVPKLRLRGGTPIDVNDLGDGKYSFAMPAGAVAVSATFVKDVPTAISTITPDATRTGVRYDLLGRPVGNDYKGIVIENGEKKIVR